MTNKEILKKQIIYRSSHRGTKEMDIILSNFVKKNINSFDKNELYELDLLLNIDDEVLLKWYLNQETSALIPMNNITKKLKKFRL